MGRHERVQGSVNFKGIHLYARLQISKPKLILNQERCGYVFVDTLEKFKRRTSRVTHVIQSKFEVSWRNDPTLSPSCISTLTESNSPECFKPSLPFFYILLSSKFHLYFHAWLMIGTLYEIVLSRTSALKTFSIMPLKHHILSQSSLAGCNWGKGISTVVRAFF